MWVEDWKELICQLWVLFEVLGKRQMVQVPAQGNQKTPLWQALSVLLPVAQFRPALLQLAPCLCLTSYRESVK